MCKINLCTLWHFPFFLNFQIRTESVFKIFHNCSNENKSWIQRICIINLISQYVFYNWVITGKKNTFIYIVWLRKLYLLTGIVEDGNWQENQPPKWSELSRMWLKANQVKCRHHPSRINPPWIGFHKRRPALHSHQAHYTQMPKHYCLDRLISQ